MKYSILAASLISSSRSAITGTNVETKDHTYKSVTLHLGGSKNLGVRDNDNRRQEGCIGFYVDSVVRYNTQDEPLMVITTEAGACAVMNITPMGDNEHSIEVLRREDDTTTNTYHEGYLGTRSRTKDERSSLTMMLGLPPKFQEVPTSRFKLVTDSRSDGFLLQQSGNIRVDTDNGSPRDTRDWVAAAVMGQAEDCFEDPCVNSKLVIVATSVGSDDYEFDEQAVFITKPFGPCDEWPGNEYHTIDGERYKGTEGSVFPLTKCTDLEMGSFYSLAASTMTLFASAAMLY